MEMKKKEKKTDEKKEWENERTEFEVNALYAKRNGYWPTSRDIKWSCLNEYLSKEFGGSKENWRRTAIVCIGSGAGTDKQFSG